MKVAITHTRFSEVGGVERYIYILVKYLVQAGHEVHYLCHFWEEEVEGVTFHRVPYHLKAIRSAKVLAFDICCRRMLRRLGPFDIVHGFSKTSRQDLYTDGSGCLEDYQVYSLSKSPLKRMLGRYFPHQQAVLAIERQRFRRGNFHKIVSMSELVREQIIRRYGLTKEEVKVIYCGVNLERFHPDRKVHREEVRRELGLKPEHPVFLFVGSDYHRKGLESFLRALARVSGARCLVVGKESLRGELKYRQLTEELGIADRVFFLGMRPDVEKLYGASDVFVFPTKFDAFGNVVLEAIASGLPCIVSSKAGAAEVIQPGRTGTVLQDPEDVDEIVAACGPYLDQKRCHEMGKQARIDSEQYSWDRHFDEMQKVYQSVVDLKCQAMGVRSAGAGAQSSP